MTTTKSLGDDNEVKSTVGKGRGGLAQLGRRTTVAPSDSTIVIKAIAVVIIVVIVVVVVVVSRNATVEDKVGGAALLSFERFL